MKKLFLLLLLIPFFSYSQQYSKVVEVPGKTIDQLYASAREWFAESFKSANDVLQMEDKVNGKLIGKGSILVHIKYNSMFATVPIILHATFTINISLRDSVYKYEIGSIFIDSGGPHSIDEYKNASTLDGARQVLINEGGMKNPSKKLIKQTAEFNADIYESLNQEFNKIIETLKLKMMSIDTW